MIRKSYVKPRIDLVEICPVEIVCQSNSIRSIVNNANIDYGGGNDTQSRANRRNIWDNE